MVLNHDAWTFQEMKMNYRKSLGIVAVSVTTLLAAAGASADSTFHAADNEAGAINHVVAGTLTRAEVLANQASEAADPLWVRTSEASGAELRQHAYAFKAGRVIHVDTIAHDTPRPVVGAADAAPLSPGN